MTISEAYKNAVSKLTESGIPDAAYDARLLFENVFSLTYNDTLLNPGLQCDSEKVAEFEKILEERISGRPLQYILGKWEFMGLEFSVGEGVLIPRSDTEILAEYAIEKIKKMKKPVVFDLCSGSGCIGLSVKKFAPEARVFMVEISDEAIHYLNLNREQLGLMRDTCLVKGDITLGFEAFSSLPKPDVILSNPPYIISDEIKDLQKEVQLEPRLALDGGKDGYDFYRVLSEKWLPFINKDGFIAVECGEEQARNIASMFALNSKETEIVKDFSGTERVVIGIK